MSNTSYVLTGVQEAFKAVFEVDPQSVSMETKVQDVPSWDSVGHLSLAAQLEQTFGLSLDVDDLMEMENVREIVRIISTKLSQRPGDDNP